MKKRYFIPTLLLLLSLLTGTALAAENTLTAERTSYGMQIDASAIRNADGPMFCALYDANGRMITVEEVTDPSDILIYCDVNAVRTARAFALTETSFIPVDVSIDTTLEAPETPIHVHTWDNGTVTTPATCEGEGVMTYACTAADCDDPLKAAYTEPIAPTGHNWGDWSGVNKTIHKRTCANDRSHTQTADHESVLQEVLTPPTETTTGRGLFNCGICGHLYADTLPMLEPKEVWFTYDEANGEYVINWLETDETRGKMFHVNGVEAYSSSIALSQLISDPAALETMDIVIEFGYYGEEPTLLYTAEDAIQVVNSEAANFTLTGQTDGTYLVGSDLDATNMTINAKLIHDDGETELVTKTYSTPYINIYPWDGSTIELSGMVYAISEDTKTLTITRTPTEKVTKFVRPEAPADHTVTTAEELQVALTVGGKVTLGADISTGSMYIYGGEPATLDLNGHTLTCSRLRFDHGKEMTIDGTAEGSAIVGELYANNADKLTIHGGSYGTLSCNWINAITLEDAIFTSAEYTTLSIYDSRTITMTGCTVTSEGNNAMTVNRGGSLTIENSTLTTSAAYSSTRYEALLSSDIATVRLVNVTASSVSGSAVELSPAPAYGSSGELHTGSSVYVHGGSYTSYSTDRSAAALQIRDFDTAEIGGVLSPAADPDDLQIYSACHGVELDDVSGAISLSDITATAIGEGTDLYDLFYVHNLETGGAVIAARLTGNGGRAHTFRVENRTSLTLELSTFTAPDNTGKTPAGISIQSVGTVAIDRTTSSGGYYSLYMYDCPDVDLSNLVLKDSSTFAMLANNCAAFDVTACEIYGDMRFDKNGTYQFGGGSWLHGNVSAYGNSAEEFVTVIVDNTCIGVDKTSINSYSEIIL